MNNYFKKTFPRSTFENITSVFHLFWLAEHSNRATECLRRTASKLWEEVQSGKRENCITLSVFPTLQRPGENPAGFMGLTWFMKVKEPWAAALGRCHSWQRSSSVGTQRGTRQWQHAEPISVICTTLTLYKSMFGKGLCIYLQDKNILILTKRICYSPNKTFVKRRLKGGKQHTHTKLVGFI